MEFDTAEICHSHAQSSLDLAKPIQANYTGKSLAAGRNSLSTFLWEGYETAVFRPGKVESQQSRVKSKNQAQE
jgi:hypothetical protein